MISIINKVDPSMSTCYLSTEGSLWYRRLAFSLISHIYVNWVVQVSEGRIRALLSEAKIIAVNMPDFGVEGW